MKLFLPKFLSGRYAPSSLPDPLVWQLYDLAKRTAAKGRVQDVLEDFIWRFSDGRASRSSTASDADLNLYRLMREKANDPPAFITAFVEACGDVHEEGYDVPTVGEINRMLQYGNAHYRFESERLPESRSLPSDSFEEVLPIEEDHATLSEPRQTAAPLVFRCHSSGDKASVRTLYRRLKQDGVRPWMDEADLMPGQKWESIIRRTVKESDTVVVCLSAASITKTGFVQKEIKIALDAADERPEGVRYIIPLRLEECAVPERLSMWHWVDLFSQGGYERLLASLRAASL